LNFGLTTVYNEANAIKEIPLATEFSGFVVDSKESAYDSLVRTSQQAVAIASAIRTFHQNLSKNYGNNVPAIPRNLRGALTLEFAKAVIGKIVTG